MFATAMGLAAVPAAVFGLYALARPDRAGLCAGAAVGCFGTAVTGAACITAFEAIEESVSPRRLAGLSANSAAAARLLAGARTATVAAGGVVFGAGSLALATICVQEAVLPSGGRN